MYFRSEAFLKYFLTFTSRVSIITKGIEFSFICNVCIKLLSFNESVDTAIDLKLHNYLRLDADMNLLGVSGLLIISFVTMCINMILYCIVTFVPRFYRR